MVMHYSGPLQGRTSELPPPTALLWLRVNRGVGAGRQLAETKWSWGDIKGLRHSLTSSSIQSYSLFLPLTDSDPYKCLVSQTLSQCSPSENTTCNSSFYSVARFSQQSVPIHVHVCRPCLGAGGSKMTKMWSSGASLPGLPLSPPHAHPLHPSPSACLPSPLPLCTSAALSLSLCSHMARVT